MVPSPPCDKIVNLKIFYTLILHNYVLRHSIKTWWKIIINKNNFFKNWFFKSPNAWMKCQEANFACEKKLRLEVFFVQL